jgi:hypothetical protein
VTQPSNTIRSFALVCVVATSAFIMGMAWWIVKILAAPQWCARALGAGNLTGKDRTVVGLDGCIDLLKIQLNSLAWNSHIVLVVLALCLLVLVVIVIADGRVSLKASKTGFEADIGADEPAAAAARVADAAVDEAQQVAQEAKP